MLNISIKGPIFSAVTSISIKVEICWREWREELMLTRNLRLFSGNSCSKHFPSLENLETVAWFELNSIANFLTDKAGFSSIAAVSATEFP